LWIFFFFFHFFCGPPPAGFPSRGPRRCTHLPNYGTPVFLLLLVCKCRGKECFCSIPPCFVRKNFDGMNPPPPTFFGGHWAPSSDLLSHRFVFCHPFLTVFLDLRGTAQNGPRNQNHTKKNHTAKTDFFPGRSGLVRQESVFQLFFSNCPAFFVPSPPCML